MTDIAAVCEYFPLRPVNVLRRSASTARFFHESLHEGWRKSPVDPMVVLAAFPVLHLSPGLILRAYHFHDGCGNGNAAVYAVPIDVPFPEPGDCTQYGPGFLSPPIPPGAIGDLMAAIEGDGSPWSYLCASMLAREIGEFGAMWHGCSWSTHRIIGRKLSGLDPDAWVWLAPAPKRWTPSAEIAGGCTKVTFYTHSALGCERLTRFVDSFQQSAYVFTTAETTLAQGPGGFVF